MGFRNQTGDTFTFKPTKIRLKHSIKTKMD